MLRQASDPSTTMLDRLTTHRPLGSTVSVWPVDMPELLIVAISVWLVTLLGATMRALAAGVRFLRRRRQPPVVKT